MNIVSILSSLVGLLTFASWLYAAINWWKAIQHRREDLTMGYMITHGSAAFRADSFKEEGQIYRQRFLRGFTAFFMCMLLGFGVVMLGIAMQ